MNNIVLEPLDYVEQKVIAKVKKEGELSVKTQRSMITTQYARRFIKQYILTDYDSVAEFNKLMGIMSDGGIK